jgi:molecular chaperone GrpE
MDNQTNQESSTQPNDQQPTQNAAESQALAKCQTELQEYKDRALRIAADFENYKKRIEKERMSWMQAAQASVLIDLLEIVDDIDRAINQVQMQPGDTKGVVAGLELMRKSLYKILQKYHITEITQLTQFDPQLHEAIMQVEGPQPSGTIVSVLQKGFMQKDHVLRPARVSISR